ncbi:3-deoxy-manno-octulosonate cytidylyltransferase [Flavipsychrobacter stenotrophus]|uniref:3-deoxy-manno-octulosonate cytidylyltransferase n=1 Tax=Flavipsychrobacter stenotrophus TaxID=2077091 RepID=A0A2S7SRR3_9BACT|nr:3-deoxy-manno-octulosonate cytidylyltransferase [Flavipsychrobacter stenotrophus]PQJ09321.1 3-deoxy-manno-octulosonate cytidylyltransferase [Flavipsychrobacter stenotrophus]
MKVIALIPARLGATRFPSKLLAPIKGKSVIHRTYESAVNTGLFDEVIVVTDSDEIMDEIIKNGGKAVKSKGTYESGTDRIAEIAEHMDADVFVNVQGDEPFVQKQPLEQLLNLFTGADGNTVQVASLVQRLTNPALIQDHNYVKVALALNNDALFFSRSVLPYPRNKEIEIPYYEHIGVYAFRKEALMNFTNWPMTPLEAAEKVECLRFLEHGVPMRMAITQYMGVEIDTPEDITRAEKLMEQNGWL